MGEINHKRPTRLKNKRCAYCHAEFLREGEPQKEHVIGLLFVPRGSHNQQWNLHLNACNLCNQAKSVLENDISAISMVAAAREFGETEHYVLQEADRKSKAAPP